MRNKLLELASALHALADSTGGPANIGREPTKDELLGEARHQFNARLLREAHFEGLPFHETGWEILLELYMAQAEGRKLNITAIGLEGHIPAATLVRWICLLEQRQLIARQPDLADRRRTWVSLTTLGIEKLDHCLRACLR